MAERKCEAGCMRFECGGVKHRRDCANYPESLTQVWHRVEAEMQSRIDELYTIVWMVANYGGELDQSLRDKAMSAVSPKENSNG